MFGVLRARCVFRPLKIESTENLLPLTRSSTNTSTLLMDKKRITVSGRKRLGHHEKRKRVYLYLNEGEIQLLNIRAADAGHKFISEYIRQTIFLENYKPRHVNPVQFFQNIKSLSLEINKVGVNINQITRHLNELRLQHVIPVGVSDAINDKLELYLIQQQEIISKLKEIIR